MAICITLVKKKESRFTFLVGKVIVHLILWSVYKGPKMAPVKRCANEAGFLSENMKPDLKPKPEMRQTFLIYSETPLTL